MATIGLRDVHYALLIDDPVVGVATYETPVKIIGAITANINPNASSATLFYDDGPGDTAATLGEISLELNLADIPLDVQAVWLGHTYENGILKRMGGDTPPWLAIGFRTLKSNGAYRYMWLNKGKFTVPEEAYNTKGDSIEFSTPTITGAFVKRDSDDEWERTTDEDAVDFDPSYISTWFLNPVTSGGAFATGNYGPTTVTVTGAQAMDGATIIIKGDNTVEAGQETAAWVSSTLTVTLGDGLTYGKGSLQALIDGASGTAVGPVTISMSGNLTAKAATTLTLNMAEM
jgi:phi13 family phage major tail protein